MPPNVRYLGHVGTGDHNAFNSSALAVLNINRDSMAAYGFSPPTRVFEAAGAGACLITDAWEGIEQFLEPGREVLVAHDGAAGGGAPRRPRPRPRARHRRRSPEARAGRAHLRPAGRSWSKRRSTGAGRRRRRHEASSSSASRITSSWGNGHATTYRGLLRELARRGHEVTFLERDVPWYAAHRDLPNPVFCATRLYRGLDELERHHAPLVAAADAVILGSYVPDGVAVGEWICATARGLKAFYDIDTPVTLAKLARGEHDYLSPAPDPAASTSISPSPAARRCAGWRTSSARPWPAPSTARSTSVPTSRRTCRCATTSAISAPTAPTVSPSWSGCCWARRAPCPKRRFAVVGPQYPDGIVWPSNVERTAHLAPPDHPAFYAAQRFT